MPEKQYKIGFVGTDARSLVSALEVSRAKSEHDKTLYRGVVVRGTPAMPYFAKKYGWPIDFIPTASNSEYDYAQALIQAFKDGRLDYAIVMPEELLYQGIVDSVSAAGFGDRIAGLDRAGVFIEANKIKCKEKCKKTGIPVADEWTVVDAQSYKSFLKACLEYIHKHGGVVPKYPFNAGGKGARIILNSWEIREVYDGLMKDYKENYKAMFGKNSEWPLLIESRMSGVEISFTALVDKNGHYKIMPTAMDYPERFPGPASKDNPITGGMGSCSPHPFETPELLEMAGRTIFDPLIGYMRSSGLLRPSFLYPGCFVSVDRNMRPIAIRVCEINIRPGEPEWQPIIRRLRNPGQVFKAMFDGDLDEIELETRSNQLSLSIALVTGPGGPQGQKGYPGSCTKGEKVVVDWEYLKKKGILLIPSAMDYDAEANQLRSDGSRVAFLLSNIQTRDGKKGEAGEILRNKLINAFKQGKVAVVKREDENGNRLDLRDDIGSHYKLGEQIFL